jgi:hypothetical protein
LNANVHFTQQILGKVSQLPENLGKYPTESRISDLTNNPAFCNAIAS